MASCKKYVNYLLEFQYLYTISFQINYLWSIVRYNHHNSKLIESTKIMSTDPKCIFCKISRKEESNEIIYEVSYFVI